MTIYTHSTGTQEVTVLEHNGEDMSLVRFASGVETWVCDRDLSEEPSAEEREAASHRAADLWTRTAAKRRARAAAKTEQVNTNELRTGDVVLVEGMVIQLGEHGSYTDRDRPGHLVHRFAGRVTNMAELTTPDGRVTGVLAGLLRSTGPESGVWFVQGNDLAYWHRVVAEVESCTI